MSNFLNSLDKGRSTEEYVLAALVSLGESGIIGDGKLVDLFIHRANLPNIMCEVKHDVMSDKTGNIAIEFFNSKSQKASGITATQCELWFHVLGREKEIWFTSVKLLKLFCNTTKPKKIIIGGGDKNSDMMIFSKEIMDDVFFKLADTKNIKQKIEELL